MNTKAPSKPVTVPVTIELPSELVAQVKELGLDLEALIISGLEIEIRHAFEAQWLTGNSEAVQNYAKLVVERRNKP